MRRNCYVSDFISKNIHDIMLNHTLMVSKEAERQGQPSQTIACQTHGSFTGEFHNHGVYHATYT